MLAFSDKRSFPDAYRAERFIFASPRGTVTSTGALCPLPQCADLAREAGEALAAAATATGPQPMLVGAVPFDAGHAHALFVAHACEQGAPAAEDAAVAWPFASAQVAATRPWPDEQTFALNVERALAAMAQGSVGKVVLARTLELSLSAPIELAGTFSALRAKRAQGGAFSVPTGPGEVFIGASPELLVRRAGRKVYLNPLAGSAARSKDPQEDRAVAQALLASDKDRREHAIVIDAIAQVLRPLCGVLSIPPQPSVISTDALWHLSTQIEGELLDPAPSSLALAQALHPTPAVCGYPLRPAQETIAQLECFDRGLFAGFVGWMRADGDGEWAVSLRCAQIGPDRAVLYAGAGIVPGSEPLREVAETRTKFRTMLSAVGVDQAIGPITPAVSSCPSLQELS